MGGPLGADAPLEKRANMKYIATINDQEFLVEIIDEGKVSLNGKIFEIDFKQIIGQPVYSLLMEGKSYEAFVQQEENIWEVMLGGSMYEVEVEDEREKRLRATSGGGVADRGEFHLKSPMPGLVVSVNVDEGQEVEKGDVLLILESMKMQNELKSPRAGTVTRIRIKPGDTVEQKQTMLSVE